MPTAAAWRRCVAALRQPRSAARLARALWIVWAFLVWNVVFDHVIVVAGREYVGAADRAAASTTAPHSYENMDAWMRPAVARGVWLATAGASVIVVSGLLLVRTAVRASEKQVTPCA